MEMGNATSFGEPRIDSMIHLPAKHPAAAQMRKALAKLYKEFPDIPAGLLGYEDESGITIARGMGHHLGPFQDDRVIGPQLEIGFNYDLLDARNEFQEAMLTKAIHFTEGVIVGPTGSGKTILIAMLISRIRRRALIVTHASVIADQIREEIKTFVGVEAGMIGGGQEDIRPITVGLIQAVRSKHPILKDIGLLIVDEGHHISASSYLRMLSACPANHRYAFTATIYKTDKSEKVIFAAIGPVIVSISVGELQDKGFINKGVVIPIYTTAVTQPLDYVSHRCWYYKGAQPSTKNPEGKPAKCPEPCTYPKDDDIMKCVYMPKGFLGWAYEQLSKDELRNQMVLTKTEEAFHKNPWTVVLTHRKDHAVYLHGELKKKGAQVHLAIGTPQMKLKIRKKNLASYREEGGILVATSSLIGEGFNAPKTSCLVRAMPSGGKVAVRQQTGRIMRPQEQESVIYDFVDDRIHRLKMLWFGRRSIYKTLGFRIQEKKFQRNLF